MYRLLTNLAPNEADRDTLVKMATDNKQGFDYDFLYALFFPEYAEPARWPTPFCVPTAVFT